MRALRVGCFASLVAGLCMALMHSVAAQATDAEKIYMACLINMDPAQRMEACTAAINAGDLRSALRDDAYVVRASLLLQQGRFDEARTDLIAARKLDPSNSAMIDAALEKVDELQAVAATPAGQERMAFLRCRTERELALRREACDLLVTSSAADPAKEAAARALRAASEVEGNDFKAALDDLDKAIALDDSKLYYREIRARTLYFSGDYSGALASYRRLEGVNMSDERTSVIAALEYLVGDRQRAISFYDSAHKSGPPGNVFLFYSALIQSELDGGKVDSFRAIEFGPLEGPFAGALLAYRLGTTDESALRASADQVPLGSRQARCMAEFSIGHRLALQGRQLEAASAFRSAVELCSTTQFEHHAARQWLGKIPQ